MHSNSLIKKYFFLLLTLLAIYTVVFFYFFDFQKGIKVYGGALAISFTSFVINLTCILITNLKGRKKMSALIIYSLLFISSLQIFNYTEAGLCYLLLSIILMLSLDVFPSLYFFKYFNTGMIVTLCAFLYPPSGILLILFLIITIFYYEEKINISQYLAGILFMVLLALETAYLTDNLVLISNWLSHIKLPTFHYEYQIPVIIVLLFILIFGLFNQYSTKYATEEIEIANKYSAIILYLFTWIIIYAFFMGDKYGLLIFISLPVSLIVSRAL